MSTQAKTDNKVWALIDKLDAIAGSLDKQPKGLLTRRNKQIQAMLDNNCMWEFLALVLKGYQMKIQNELVWR